MRSFHCFRLNEEALLRLRDTAGLNAVDVQHLVAWFEVNHSGSSDTLRSALFSRWKVMSCMTAHRICRGALGAQVFFWPWRHITTFMAETFL